MIKFKSFFTKLFYWEHWPSFMFYTPLLPYYIYKTIKAGNLFYHAAANPGIRYGGNGTESKYETLQLIPKKYIPTSIFIQSKYDFNNVLDKIKEFQLTFPLIAKPDIGFRGYLVKKINSEKELEIYLKKNRLNTIVQEYIDYKNECGIFYHRIPGNSKGQITSITLKKFPSITGNGTSTLAELIKNDKRAFLYFDLMTNIHQKRMNSIPELNQTIPLSVIGNHSKGTQFLNGNHLINNKLTSVFDSLSNDINGWYFGRIDLKYSTIEELNKGENFKILEINGVISEPTHIYDSSKISYFKALKVIKKHWEIIGFIAQKNHLTFEVSYPKTSSYFKDLLWLRKYAEKLKNLNK